MRLGENVQNGTKMGGAGRGIAADAAGGHSDTDREAGHSGTAARRHGRDKGKRGHDVVVPLPEAVRGHDVVVPLPEAAGLAR